MISNKIWLLSRRGHLRLSVLTTVQVIQTTNRSTFCIKQIVGEKKKLEIVRNGKWNEI